MLDGDDELLRRALSGDDASVRTLVDLLTPVIHVRVARTLLRVGRGRLPRGLRQDVEDMTQEVLAALFDDGARALRAWDPERGLTLVGFVGLLAQRRVVSIMRSGRRDPWRNDPLEPSELDRTVDDASSIDLRVASRELLGLVLERLEEALSPQGFDMFRRLYVQQQSVAVVRDATGLNEAAIYAWRSRLRKLAHRIASDLENVSPDRSDSSRSTRSHLEDAS